MSLSPPFTSMQKTISQNMRPTVRKGGRDVGLRTRSLEVNNMASVQSHMGKQQTYQGGGCGLISEKVTVNTSFPIAALFPESTLME